MPKIFLFEMKIPCNLSETKWMMLKLINYCENKWKLIKFLKNNDYKCK